MRVVPRIGYAYSSRMQETASWDIFYAQGRSAHRETRSEERPV